MTSALTTAAKPRAGRSLLIRVSYAHFVSHLYIMVVPALIYLLQDYFSATYFQLGFALSIFSVVTLLVQAPLGFAVDKFGARRVLVAGIVLGSVSLGSLAFVSSFWWLVVAMALAGLSNGVYHPADYALLSRGIRPSRMGRAFSVHTFSGYFGTAVAPPLLMGVATAVNVPVAFLVATGLGLLAVPVLQWRAGPEPLVPQVVTIAQDVAEVTEATQASKATEATAKSSPKVPAATGYTRKQIFSPLILSLVLLFFFLTLSETPIDTFTVPMLTQGFEMTVWWSNTILTAFLFTRAFGVLAGGVLADRTKQHGLVAAAAFASTAVFLLIAILVHPGEIGILLLFSLTGFLGGIIAPSRDMLVRAASPVGAEGRVFGVVSTGFSLGGILGPIFIGWILDAGYPVGLLWVAVVFMVLTVLLSIQQDVNVRRRQAREINAAGKPNS